jgi:hypothetical protein
LGIFTLTQEGKFISPAVPLYKWRIDVCHRDDKMKFLTLYPTTCLVKYEVPE